MGEEVSPGLLNIGNTRGVSRRRCAGKGEGWTLALLSLGGRASMVLLKMAGRAFP